jgi:hypothetical protein
VLADFPRDDPPLRVVCGTGHGDWIAWAECASGEDDLFGFAVHAPPAGGNIDCLADWVSYSRGDDHSICWHAAKGEEPDVWPMATAPDPFDDPASPQT